jgi:hypothetical protein
VVGQDADGDRLERPVLLHRAIDVSQQINVLHQQIARAISKGYGKKLCAAFNACAPISGHT